MSKAGQSSEGSGGESGVGDRDDLESVAEWDDGVAGAVAEMLLQSSEASSE